MQNRPKPKPFFRPRVPQNEHRLNNEITALEVRVIGDDIEPGIYPVADAIKMAIAKEVDLVEISPNAVPPVCRIIDYKKFLYEKKKKDKYCKYYSQSIVVFLVSN